MSQAKPSPEQIERELAALGEAPPTPAELELAAAESSDEPGWSDAAPELASVARLVELTEAPAFDDLSELESHRTWRQIEQRLGGATQAAGARDHDAGEPREAHEGGAHRGGAHRGGAHRGGGPQRWLSAAFGLAAAAAVLIVVLASDQGELADSSADPSAEEVAELGEQVRASLRVLDDGKSDSERAAERAAEYQRRLDAREERGG